jgi:hypothetical protein
LLSIFRLKKKTKIKERLTLLIVCTWFINFCLDICYLHFYNIPKRRKILLLQLNIYMTLEGLVSNVMYVNCFFFYILKFSTVQVFCVLNSCIQKVQNRTAN